MNEPVRICLVGAGRVARVHAQSLTRHLPGAEIVAVVDPAAEARRSLAQEFAIPAQYAALEEALEKESTQAVVITTPTPSHAPLAVQAASRGQHIFLEKPMALSLAECDVILQACHQNGVLLQLGFMRRFDPEFNTALGKIEAGEIGQPMMIKSLTHGPGLPPPWARDLQTSNGMLAEVNSHDWDTLRWLMGDEYDRVYAEVANLKGAALQVDTPNFYDNALVNVRFRRGGLGMISGICSLM